MVPGELPRDSLRYGKNSHTNIPRDMEATDHISNSLSSASIPSVYYWISNIISPL